MESSFLANKKEEEKKKNEKTNKQRSRLKNYIIPRDLDYRSCEAILRTSRIAARNLYN